MKNKFYIFILAFSLKSFSGNGWKGRK